MKKKIIFLLYLGLIGFFHFQSWSVNPVPLKCEYVFKGLLNSHKKYNNSYIHLTKGESLKLVKQQEKSFSAKSLINYIPYTVSSGNFDLGRLSAKWKDQVVRALTQFESYQLFNLLDKLAVLGQRLDLEYEKSFFRILEKESVRHLPSFNKEQLISIIWVLTQLDMKTPNEDFVRVWRETAKKKSLEFTSKERFGLYSFFKQLQIPSQTLSAEKL